LGAASASSIGNQPQVSLGGIEALSRDVKAQEYWAKRFIAYVVDAVIVYSVIGLAVAATYLPTFFAGIFIPGYSPPTFPFGALFGTFANLIFVLYFAV